MKKLILMLLSVALLFSCSNEGNMETPPPIEGVMVQTIAFDLDGQLDAYAKVHNEYLGSFVKNLNLDGVCYEHIVDIFKAVVSTESLLDIPQDELDNVFEYIPTLSNELENSQYLAFVRETCTESNDNLAYLLKDIQHIVVEDVLSSEHSFADNVRVDLIGLCKSYLGGDLIGGMTQQSVLEIFGVAIGSTYYWEDQYNEDYWFETYLTVQAQSKKKEGETNKEKGEREKKAREAKEKLERKQKIISFVQDDIMGACAGSVLGPGGAVTVGSVMSGLTALSWERK